MTTVSPAVYSGHIAVLGRTEVAERSGYEASGGTFARYVSALSSLGLVVYPRRTALAAAPWLFPEVRP